MLEKVKKISTNNIFDFHFVTVLVFSLFICLPFVKHYVNGDDSFFHVANIIAYGENLFKFPYKIFPDFYNNLGYGIGLFYPPLPHAIGGIIYSLGVGAIESLKILKVIIVSFSGITMYFLGRKLFKDNSKGMIAAILYISQSYFFTDLFFRDALNESFVFIFIPLVFLGIYYLFEENNRKRFYIYFILGYTGIIYSHLVMSVWFTIFFIIFLLLFIKKIIKKKLFIPLLISFLIIFVLSATYTVPLLEQKLFGFNSIFQPVARNEKNWVIPYYSFFLQVVSIANADGGKLVFFFGFATIILSGFTIFGLINQTLDKTIKKYCQSFIILFVLIMLFVCLNPIWRFVPNLLLSIQFPWRLVTYASFFLCLFATAGLDSVYKLSKKDSTNIIVILLCLLVVLINMTKVVFIDNFMSLSRTLEPKGITYHNLKEKVLWAGCGWDNEYLTTAADSHHNELLAREPNKILLLKGTADVKTIKNNVPDMTFSVKNIKTSAILELPRIYYLGYKIISPKGKRIKYKQSEYGLIQITIKNEGIYHLKYTGTKLFEFFLVIKIVTVVFIIWSLFNWYKCYRKRRKKK